MLELVLVNAAATDLSEFDACLGEVPVIAVNTGQRLSRPQAANAGLKAAGGDYLMFLDEDDWIGDSHVQDLVEFLHSQNDARAVYSSTQRVDADNNLLDYIYAQDFDPAILRRDNFIPVHAMLFSKDLLQHGCAFDESFDIYEDWDFWLQLSQHTPFAHLNVISAFYRTGGDSNTALDDEMLRFAHEHPNAIAREKVFDKWLPDWSGAELNKILANQQAELVKLNDALRVTDQQLVALNREHGKKIKDYDLLTKESEVLERKQQAELVKLNDALRVTDQQLVALNREHEKKIKDYDLLTKESEVLERKQQAELVKLNDALRVTDQQLVALNRKHEKKIKDYDLLTKENKVMERKQQAKLVKLNDALRVTDQQLVALNREHEKKIKDYDLLTKESEVLERRQQAKLVKLNDALRVTDQQLVALNREHEKKIKDYDLLTKESEVLERRQQAELVKLNDTLRVTDQQLVALNREHEKKIKDYDLLTKRTKVLERETADLQAAHTQLDQALREILSSFSWRITSPYRFLSNRITRYLLRPITGGVKNAARIFTENPALHQALRSLRTKVPRQNDHGIYFFVESPSASSQPFTEFLEIRGWAFSSHDGLSIESCIDDHLYRCFNAKQQRADVAQVHTGIPNAECSGFGERIVLDFLSSGRHTLKLVFTDTHGHCEEYEQAFYRFRKDELYRLWARHQASAASGHATHNTGTMVNILLDDGGTVTGALDSIRSITAQTYKDVRLFYAGDNWDVIAGQLNESGISRFQSEVVIVDSPAEAADRLRTGEFLLGMKADERLQPHALAELLNDSVNCKADLVYCDHDFLDDSDEHREPVFTFGWSPDHLVCDNYIGNVFLLRCTAQTSRQLAGCDIEAWRYAMLLEHLDIDADRVSRVAKVLWSRPAESPAQTRRRLDSEQAALENHLASQAIPARVSRDERFRYVDWQLNAEPLVSIIIPTMGKLELLHPCLESLLDNTAYRNYELVMLDNSRGRFPEGIAYLKDKNLTVIECDEDFNWARLNNIGARHAKGEYLLFLNDDIEIIDGNWLHELIKQAQRKAVGAVGALLYYPNGAIQHAGIFLVGHGGGCAHLFHRMMPNSGIYQRLDETVREVSAVTGACLMLARNKFEELDGFDEELAVVGNDVDLCLRLLQSGYRNIWTPKCRLVHHESISRKTIAPKEDEAAMWRRWGDQFRRGDFYYNPNLSREKWDCSLRIDISATELIEGVELQERNWLRPESQKPAPGVTLIAYIRAEMGLGEAARSDARAMEAAAIDFDILNFEYGNPGRMADLSWQHKECVDAPGEVVLMHINPDFLLLAKQGLPKEFFNKRYLIVYWAWELEEIPEDWIPALDEVDEVWVPSNFVKAAIEQHAKVPVVTIPHCLNIEPSVEFSKSYFGLPENSYIFLAMFDTNSVAERKNPFAAINAFKRAFDRNDKSVCLVLKVNSSGGKDESALMSAISAYPNIRLIHQTRTRSEINSLLTNIDCYVSLHRSEGFGLGPAEAMCLGKATIITNWSGSTDFMTPDNCMAIDYRLVELERAYGPYRRGQRWAEPDIEQAVEAMRTLVANPELGTEAGLRAQQTIRESFSPSAVGKLMRARLESIGRIDPEDN